jgi:hypothetical protein
MWPIFHAPITFMFCIGRAARETYTYIRVHVYPEITVGWCSRIPGCQQQTQEATGRLFMTHWQRPEIHVSLELPLLGSAADFVPLLCWVRTGNREFPREQQLHSKLSRALLERIIVNQLFR